MISSSSGGKRYTENAPVRPVMTVRSGVISSSSGSGSSTDNTRESIVNERPKCDGGVEDSEAGAENAREEFEREETGNVVSEDEATEQRHMKKIKDPLLPTQEEIEYHNLTHLPYRDWCPHCIRGRGKQEAHYKAKGERTMHELCFDYCFLGGSLSNTVTIPTMVIRDRDTRMTCSYVVGAKGTKADTKEEFNMSFTVSRAIAFIKEMGLENATITLKSDQEPSIKDVLNDIARVRTARAFIEHSPVKSSQSNGVAERAIQSVEAQVRVMRDALGSRIGATIPEDHPILHWVVEYASVLLNRFEVGHDGKTAYERLRGKKSSMNGIEFGELVHYRRTNWNSRKGKLDIPWYMGTYVGYRTNSGEMIIADEDGIHRTRSMKKLPREQRWQETILNQIKDTPMTMKNCKTKEDQEEKETQRTDVFNPPEARKVQTEAQEKEEEEAMPRSFHIIRRDIERYGPTSKCNACRALLRGDRVGVHSALCRRRFEEELRKTEEGRERLDRAMQKQNEYIGRKIEDEARSKRKTQDDDEEIAKRRREDDVRGNAQTDTMKRCMDDRVEQGGKEEIETGISTHQEQECRKESNTGVKRRKTREDRETGNGIEEVLEVACEEADTDYYKDMVEMSAYDDITGEELDARLVCAARNDELREMIRRKVWNEVDMDHAVRTSGHKPIQVRWIDHNKGSKDRPCYRSRLVAKEMKQLYGGKERDDVFAGMPPLEALKALLVWATMEFPQGQRGKLGQYVKKVCFLDVSKAYLYAPVDKEIFIELPEEFKRPGMCGRLNYALYGTRDAARYWEDELRRTFTKLGFVPGSSSPSLYWHPVRELRTFIHGDDIVSCGPETSLRWLNSELKKLYLIKMRGMIGPEVGDEKVASILNRTVSWTHSGIVYEADSRHAARIISQLGLEAANGTKTPGGAGSEEAKDELELDSNQSTQYRMIAARLNYLAADRPDLQFTVKEICRCMSRPTQGSWNMLKKVGRYLCAHKRMVIKFPYQPYVECIKVYVDTDYGGCRRTRKSTNGGAAMWGAGLIKSWASTQSVVALSSGEAEYYGLVKGGCIAIGIKSMLEDWGLLVKLRLYTDSSAGRGICMRSGLGKVRHIELQYLWLQEKVRSRILEIAKIKGTANPADIFTKYITRLEMIKHTCNLGAEFIE